MTFIMIYKKKILNNVLSVIAAFNQQSLLVQKKMGIFHHSIAVNPVSRNPCIKQYLQVDQNENTHQL